MKIWTLYELWAECYRAKDKSTTVFVFIPVMLFSGWGHSLPTQNSTPPFYQSPPKHISAHMASWLVLHQEIHTAVVPSLFKGGAAFPSAVVPPILTFHILVQPPEFWAEGREQDIGRQGRDKHYFEGHSNKIYTLWNLTLGSSVTPEFKFKFHKQYMSIVTPLPFSLNILLTFEFHVPWATLE